MAKSTQSVTVTIDFVPGLEGSGCITKLAKNKYKIKVSADEPVAEQVGTLFHEVAHLACWLVLEENAIDEKREHVFCRKVDAYAKRWFLKV